MHQSFQFPPAKSIQGQLLGGKALSLDCPEALLRQSCQQENHSSFMTLWFHDLKLRQAAEEDVAN